MVLQHPQRYFWIKYYLAVLLLIVLVILSFAFEIKVGIVLLLFLAARTIVGPYQMRRLTKKGKFDDLQYLKVRNKQNVFIGILVIIAVILLFIILVYNLFTVGQLSLPVLVILTVFIIMDVGYDFLTFHRLEKTG